MISISSPRPGKSLVILDDEPLVLDALGQLLKYYLTCPIHTFRRPLAALEALASLNPGVVVTDYTMPEMNGLDFIRAAQPLAPDVRFLMITGEMVEFSPDGLQPLPNFKTIFRKPVVVKQLVDFVLKNWPEAEVPVPQSELISL